MKNSKDKSECHNNCFKIRCFCRFSLKKFFRKNQKKNQKNEIGCFSISGRLEVRFLSYDCFIGSPCCILQLREQRSSSIFAKAYKLELVGKGSHGRPGRSSQKGIKELWMDTIFQLLSNWQGGNTSSSCCNCPRLGEREPYHYPPEGEK